MRSSGDYQVALRWSRRACSPPLAPPRSRASRSVDGTRPEEGGNQSEPNVIRSPSEVIKVAIRGHQWQSRDSTLASRPVPSWSWLVKYASTRGQSALSCSRSGSRFS